MIFESPQNPSQKSPNRYSKSQFPKNKINYPKKTIKNHHKKYDNLKKMQKIVFLGRSTPA
jgi:hypothetical protein